MPTAIEVFRSGLDQHLKVTNVECVLLEENAQKVSRGYFFQVDEDRYHFHPTDAAPSESITAAKNLCAYPDGAFGKAVNYRIHRSEKCNAPINVHWHMTLIKD